LSINLVLASGTLPKLTVVRQLPERRFVRVAFLAEGPSTRLAQLSTPCFPNTDFVVGNLKYQVEPDPVSGIPTLTWPIYGVLRGVKGWTQASCVLVGDGAPHSTPDDRDTKLDALSELYPTPVEMIPE